MEISIEKRNWWKAKVDQYKQSNQSLQAFCKAQNISYYTLNYWRHKFRDEENPVSFVKIKSLEYRQSLQNNGCEIIFTNGNRVHFTSLPELNFLKQLLS